MRGLYGENIEEQDGKNLRWCVYCNYYGSDGHYCPEGIKQEEARAREKLTIREEIRKAINRKGLEE